jgi:hypothetical protein
MVDDIPVPACRHVSIYAVILIARLKPCATTAMQWRTLPPSLKLRRTAVALAEAGRGAFIAK